MMNKFAVLPLAALAFSAACSDTSQNPLAAPDQAPQLSLATPGGAFGIHTLSAALQADGTYNVTVEWNALAGAESYESKLVRCPGSAADCGRSADAGKALKFMHKGVISNSGKVKARVIANLKQGKQRTPWCTLTLATNEVVCASTGGGGGGGSDTNNAPEAQLSLANIYTVSEGGSLTFQGTASDADNEAVNWEFRLSDGTTTTVVGNGTVAAGSSAGGPPVSSSSISFPDGPKSFTITLWVSDTKASDSDTENVTVNNVAPTATFGNSGPVAEGSTWTLSLTGAADASAVDATAGFTYNFNCGSGYAESFGSSSSITCPPVGDNGTPRVAAQIKDKDGGVTEYTGNVTVTNVAPTRTNPTSFSYNPYTGVAEATVSFSDPGWEDIVTANFSGVLNPTSNTAGPETSGPLTGTFTASQTFSAGACITGAISVRVSDDDATATSGFFDHTFAAAGTLERNTAMWMAPIKGGVRNVVKHGNVIPVKLSVLDCNGNAVTNKTLSIRLLEGTSSTDASGTDEVTQNSVSAADTNGQMRVVDSHYMYNLDTKGLQITHPYTIVIRDAANHVVATAIISTK